AVAAGDDRGRVAGRDQHVGRRLRPAPVAKAGAEDLEERGAEEDPGEDGGARGSQDKPREERQAKRAGDVNPPREKRQPGEAGDGPGGGQRQRDAGDSLAVAGEEGRPRCRQPEQVDEAVTGRNVEGEGGELVAV